MPQHSADGAARMVRMRAESGGERPQARGRKSGARRTEIIRTAIGIINARSYELATMREIAAALDLRDAALYYYCPSKQALAYAAHVYSLERFERTLTLATDGGGTGLERLRRFLLHFLEESNANGPQLYFGEHTYLDENQRGPSTNGPGGLPGPLLPSCRTELVTARSGNARWGWWCNYCSAC